MTNTAKSRQLSETSRKKNLGSLGCELSQDRSYISYLLMKWLSLN
jgi:hypothetical protein